MVSICVGRIGEKWYVMRLQKGVLTKLYLHDEGCGRFEDALRDMLFLRNKGILHE